MNSDANTITPVPDYKLQIEWADGRTEVFDARPCLQMPALAALQDIAHFSRVSVLFGAATWPDGEDTAPGTLSAELQTLQYA